MLMPLVELLVLVLLLFLSLVIEAVLAKEAFFAALQHQ